jgi:hypothetical protein
MKGLQEAVKGIKFLDRDEVIRQGARAYRLGIEQRANPRKGEGEQKLWDIGWEKERDAFSALLKRNGGTMR